MAKTNNRMNPVVDPYFTEGCGRCPLGGTPDCKVHKWPEELKALRSIVLDCGLAEEMKWRIPCYTFQKRNVVLISAFKEYCALSFFKGVMLKDPHGILDKPGENSQAVRLIKFTNVEDIVEMESVLKAYIQEAIEVEKTGLKVKVQKNPEPIPEEFQEKLDENPSLKKAFEAFDAGPAKRVHSLFFRSQTIQNPGVQGGKIYPANSRGEGLL